MRARGAPTGVPDDDEENGIFEKIEQRIIDTEKRRASKEASWDGFCGLVKISDDDAIREQGYIGPPQEALLVQGKRFLPAAAGAGGASSSSGSGAAGAAEPQVLGIGPELEGLESELAFELAEADDGSGDAAPHSTARERMAASISGAGKTVAASINGASSRISLTLSGGLHAAAEEAARIKELIVARVSESGEADAEAGQPSEAAAESLGSGTEAAAAAALPPHPHSPMITERLKSWAGGIGHGGSSLAAQLNKQLAAVLHQPDPRTTTPPASPDQQGARADDLGDEVHRRRSATAIATEAFKAAAVALEDNRPQEAKELAEVALKGVPDSKPRARKKVQSLRERAAALLARGHGLSPDTQDRAAGEPQEGGGLPGGSHGEEAPPAPPEAEHRL